MGSCCVASKSPNKDTIIDLNHKGSNLNFPSYMLNKDEQDKANEKLEIHLIDRNDKIDENYNKEKTDEKPIRKETKELTNKENQKLMSLIHIYTLNFDIGEKECYEDQLKTQREEIKKELLKNIYTQIINESNIGNFNNIVEIFKEFRIKFFDFLNKDFENQSLIISLILDLAEILYIFKKFEKLGELNISFYFKKYKSFFQKLKISNKESFSFEEALKYEEENENNENNEYSHKENDNKSNKEEDNLKEGNKENNNSNDENSFKSNKYPLKIQLQENNI